jgi:hypothetical protein
LPVLVETSIQIASDQLERSGEFEDPEVANISLCDTIELTVRQGERRRLLLSNGYDGLRGFQPAAASRLRNKFSFKGIFD